MSLPGATSQVDLLPHTEPSSSQAAAFPVATKAAASGLPGDDDHAAGAVTLSGDGAIEEEEKKPEPYAEVTYWDIAKEFSLMGYIAFGGPAAHIGLFQRVGFACYCELSQPRTPILARAGNTHTRPCACTCMGGSIRRPAPCIQVILGMTAGRIRC